MIPTCTACVSAGTRRSAEKKNARYKAALEAFAKTNAEHELFAMAQFQLAGVLQSEGDLVKAREIALAGMNAFPESPGGKLCFNLIQGIEAEVIIGHDRTSLGRAAAEYQRLVQEPHKVYFRVVKADYIERLKQARWRPEQLDRNEAQALLKHDPVLSFDRDLPATPDYQQRTEAIPAPKGLKPGFYYLIASHDANFAGNGPVVYTDFFVTDLAIVERQDYASGAAEGQVTTANAGTPVEGAKVQTWLRQNNGGWVRWRCRYHRQERALLGSSGSQPRSHGCCHAQGPDSRDRERQLLRRHPRAASMPRANGLLHRPLALPTRPDDPLQGHRHAGRSGERQLRSRTEPRTDGAVQRREWQGNREGSGYE